MSPYKNAFALSGFVIATSIGAVATAQEQAPDADQKLLDTITIYGAKFDQSLEDMTASVDVVTGAEIAREPVSDIYDIVERIPNVNTSFGGQGFAIRGIDQRGVGNAGSGQTLTVYVDDAPLGNFTTFFGPTGAWDLGQVEVFRGPQSTNFGRNALAGAIYIRTEDPSFETDFKVRTEVGQYGLRQYAAAGGGAIIDDVLAYRISAEHREADGFIDNVFLDQPADATELENLRGKLLFQPTDSVKIISTTSYTENFAGEDVVIPEPAPGADAFEREAFYDTPGHEGTDTFLQSVNATWDITGAISLQSITSYQSTDYVRIEDFDGSPAPIADLSRVGEDEALAQEFRLRYQGDRFNGALGLYYVDTEETYDDSFIVPATALDPSLPLSILISRTSTLQEEATNYAVFFDGEYKLTDDFDLLFGARYDVEEQDAVAQAVTEIVTPLPPGFEFLRAFEGVSEETTEPDFEAFLPKVGLRWDGLEQTSLAFVVQKAYRAGGEEILAIGGTNEFDPEYLWNYELSSRSKFMDGALRVNANAFYSTWEDQQVSEPLSPQLTSLFRTVNAGESTLYGFEADVNYSVTDALQVWGALGYVSTEFDDFINANPAPGEPANFAGNAFPFAPELSLNAGVDFNAENGFFTGFDVNYSSEAFPDHQNRSVNELDAHTLVNARVGFAFGADDAHRVTIYARNLFDEEYYTNLSRVNVPGAARVSDPRVVGMRLDLDF